MLSLQKCGENFDSLMSVKVPMTVSKKCQNNETNLTLVNIDFHKNSFGVLLCQLLENRCNSLTRSTPKYTNTHTQSFYCSSGICLGPPGWAGTRKI